MHQKTARPFDAGWALASAPKTRSYTALPNDRMRETFTGRYKRVGHSHTMVVPGELAKILNWHYGDYIAIERLGDRIVCRKISRDYVLGKDDVDARKLMRRAGETDERSSPNESK